MRTMLRLTVCVAAWAAASLPALSWTHGSSSSIVNNQSPLGFGFGGQTFTVEQPFLNLIHSGSYWTGPSNDIALTNVSQGAADVATGTGSVAGTALTVTNVASGTFRKNQTVTGTSVTANSVISSGNDCNSASVGNPCTFTLSQASTASSTSLTSSGHYVRISLSSNAPVIEATITGSISNDLEVQNLTTATGVTVSGNVMNIPSTNIAGTFLLGYIVQSTSITGNPTITANAGSGGTPCGGIACTGNGGAGTYALSASFTVSVGESIKASNVLVPILHVTATSDHVRSGAYLSAGNKDTKINDQCPPCGADQAIGQLGTYRVCDDTCANQTLGSQTILLSGIGVGVGGVTGPTEANSCSSIIPVNDGHSFDCVGVDYSGTAWGGTGTMHLNYAEYQFVYQLDANGYLTSMATTNSATVPYVHIATVAGAGINAGSGINPTGRNGTAQIGPYYPSGQYVAQYIGGSGGCGGTVSYGNDGTCAQTVSQGYDVINVTPSQNGIDIKINDVSGGYVHGMSLVYCGTYSASAYLPSHCSTGYDTLLANGAIFNPVFIAKAKIAGTLRFMDWMQTNNTIQQNWSGRPLTSQAFWTVTVSPNQNDPMPGGVPIEAMIALANEIGADPWFNMPPLATDNYITQFATLVHSTLQSNLRAYTEPGNEIWNGCFGSLQAFRYMMITSASVYPNYLNLCDANRQYYESLRAMQTRSLWKTAWGSDANRVFGVLSGQGGAGGSCSSGRNSNLNCTLLTQLPGEDGSSIATQWTAYGLRTDTGSSSSAAISGVVLTAGGTSSGLKVKQLLAGSNITSPTMIAFDASNTASTSCGGSPCTGNGGNGTYGLSAASTVSAEAITSAAVVASNIDVFAIGKYLENCVPVPDSFTLDQFFTEMNVGGLIGGDCPGGWLPATIAQAASDYVTAQGFILPMWAYEMGQQFVGGGDDTLSQLYANATRDPRMGTAFASLFANWKSIGATGANYFVMTSSALQFGDFLALENINQSTAPTYGAINVFNAANPCWWDSQAPWASAGGCR